ncbi:MAG TPA: N-acetylmuramoyl-L-alanine amidase [Candidatus Sulfotelmatobacter sp.]|nr:N-acetylmuramoyl-L-alanine amidase [Candidatus Sulfotelmatobacter sp.]
MKFARFSPVFALRVFATQFPRAGAVLLLASASAIPCFAAARGAATNASAEAGAADTARTADTKRAAATAQFDRAEEQRTALNEKPANKRTLAEYKQVVTTYRRVFLITPRAPEVPESLSAVGQLYTEMGDRFGRSYYQSAVDSYRFLMREYPSSKLSQDAMLKVAALEKDQLGDPRTSAKIYEDFLKKYPHSSRRREAQEARAELALTQGESAAKSGDDSGSKSSRGSGVNAKNSDDSDVGSTEGVAPLPPATPTGGTPRVRRITTKATPDSTRVTIDLEDTVQYSSARIKNPDRIFFDIHDARLTSEVAKANVKVEGNLLTAVRAAQNHSGIVRVVLDVNGVKEYNASLQDNPPALVIDLYAKSGGAPRMAKGAKSAPVVDAKGEAELADVLPAGPANATGKTKEITPPNAPKGVDAADLPTDATAGSATPAKRSNTGVSSGGSRSVGANSDAATESASASATAPNSSGSVGTANLPPSLVRSDGLSKKSKKGAKPDLIQPASAAQPTRDGQSTLTRTLGLKIGRIVIDAGHGGHDTGTIGPTGLMEKDLCLDVALRLGKIIQQRLPGADVVYTRSDDTFIPLEERTHIANEARADLFISIHANSSHDHGARGIETYYLNLKGSPDAMEVASRENATANESIHDLDDIVKKIARSEKIDESREFASDIQDSLSKRIQKQYKPVKDRGVRKAPFVVLIGADMPSILTEISFLSNPADEQLLKKPEHRQRVAEGLYQGVADYLQSLNSMTGIQPKLPVPRAAKSVAAASVDSPRNQR